MIIPKRDLLEIKRHVEEIDVYNRRDRARVDAVVKLVDRTIELDEAKTIERIHEIFEKYHPTSDGATEVRGSTSDKDDAVDALKWHFNKQDEATQKIHDEALEASNGYYGQE